MAVLGAGALSAGALGGGLGGRVIALVGLGCGRGFTFDCTTLGSGLAWRGHSHTFRGELRVALFSYKT